MTKKLPPRRVTPVAPPVFEDPGDDQHAYGREQHRRASTALEALAAASAERDAAEAAFDAQRAETIDLIAKFDAAKLAAERAIEADEAAIARLEAACQAFTAALEVAKPLALVVGYKAIEDAAGWSATEDEDNSA